MKRFLLLLLTLGALTSAAAREVYPLNDGWLFFFSHENSGDRARSISLPHTWNGDALAGVYPYLRTQALYSRDLYIPAEWSGKRLFLRFYGVSDTADLFVNGTHAGAHCGAGVAFTFEITDKVNCGADNRLLVAVSNTQRSDLMLAAERNLYGGITRGVELLVTDPVAVSPLHLGTEGLLVHTDGADAARAEGHCDLYLSIPSPRTVEVTLRALNADGEVVFSQRRTLKSSFDDSKPLSVPFSIERPRLWSPAHPELYRFTAEVSAAGSRDEVSVSTGLRKVELTPDRGLCINGEPLRIHGVSLAYDHSRCAALLGPEEYDTDFDLLRDLGANALRSPSGPHGQYLYDRCDREGMLVWIDLPFAGTGFLSDLCYFASPAFERNGEQLLRELIAQNLNHPSVILWGLFTDLRSADKHLKEYVERLNRTAQSCDPSRPTVAVSNQNGDLNFIPAGIVWHQTVGWERGLTDDLSLWLEKLGSNWSHLASAVLYGAEGFAEQQPDSYGRPTPGTLELPERRQTRFIEDYARQLQADTLLWGEWVDGLSDYGAARRDGGRNGSGLVDFDRKTRKDGYYLLRALWNRTSPTLHIAERRWENRPDKPHRLRVYASEGLEPIMLVNGDTVALEQYALAMYRSEEFMLEKENTVEVRAGGLSDCIRFRCGSELKAPMPTAPLQTINLQRRD